MLRRQKRGTYVLRMGQIGSEPVTTQFWEVVEEWKAAHAQHLGATGLTFFDDDVINFFSPHAKDKSAIFLLAIGKPLKRKPQ